MKYIGIIPARMAATRFPGKPLVPILGMPMIGHCYHRTALALGADNVFVATCDDEIAGYIDGIGGKIVMTSREHNRATTRTAEALEHIEREGGDLIDVVVMVQGDEPLIPPELIRETLNHFSDPEVNIVNIMSRIATLENFIDENNVKVVVDRKGDALYFSREPIPSKWKGWEQIPKFMQTGIIAFRRDALIEFNATQESSLEKIESIDMNRVLENGGHIRMVSTDSYTIGVDTIEELQEAERYLREQSTSLKYLNL